MEREEESNWSNDMRQKYKQDQDQTKGRMKDSGCKDTADPPRLAVILLFSDSGILQSYRDGLWNY